MSTLNANNLGYVAELRALQHLHETPVRRNPDHLVAQLFPWRRRLRHRWMSGTRVSRLQADPFYHYLLARTRHYDAAYRDALARGARWIVNIGCGSDTRAHRLAGEAAGAGVTVLEADLPDAIAAKQRQVTRLGAAPHVRYLPMDLNLGAWPDFEPWLARAAAAPAWVMLEGVSPYVDAGSFAAFLRLLAERLPPGTRIAYDYKIAGAAPAFDAACTVAEPFRLPDDASAVASFHAGLGLHLDAFEPAATLQRRMGTVHGLAVAGPFGQDVVLELSVM